jgi:hypothetical protein
MGSSAADLQTSDSSNPEAVSKTVTADVEWINWTSMRPNSFPIDIQFALKSSDDGQCARLVGENLMTVAECDEALMKEKTNKCIKNVIVQNGTKLTGVTGLEYRNGKLVPTVFPNRIVDLPHNPIATQCTLNNGKILYFFDGEPGVSCYNLGLKLPEKIVQESVPTIETSEHCEFIPTGIQTQEGSIDIVPGYISCDACGYVTGSASTAVLGTGVKTTQVSGGRIICYDNN